MKELKEKKAKKLTPISEQKKDLIIQYYKSGMSVSKICILLSKTYKCPIIASVIAKENIMVEKKQEYFLVIPSKMNYKFRMSKF